ASPSAVTESSTPALPVQIINFRTGGCRRLEQLLLDLFLNALEPAFGADSAVLRAFDLRAEAADPIFGGPQPLARPLKHLDDGAGGLVDGNAIPPRFPRCESEHLVRCTDRALTDSCPAMRGARAPRSRSWDRRRGIHTTEHELK